MLPVQHKQIDYPLGTVLIGRLVKGKIVTRPELFGLIRGKKPIQTE